MTVDDKASFSRNEIVEFLEQNRIQTRNLFSGNLVRQPMFDSLVEGQDYRISGILKNTDIVMNRSFWIGVYPGMDKNAISYMIDKINKFITKKGLQ